MVEPANESATSESGNADANAMLMRKRAERWVRLNPQAWKLIETQLSADVAAKRKGSIAHAVERVRHYDLVDATGKPCRINNTLQSALIRLFLEEHPEGREYLELRRSKCDMAFRRCPDASQ